MKTFKEYTISQLSGLSEAAYPGNIGFVEVCQFHKKATPEQEKLMDEIMEKEDWDAFKELIKKVLKVELH